MSPREPRVLVAAYALIAFLVPLGAACHKKPDIGAVPLCPPARDSFRIAVHARERPAIEGQVTDQDTRAPIAGALVTRGDEALHLA
jgi:hypothetical protein